MVIRLDVDATGHQAPVHRDKRGRGAANNQRAQPSRHMLQRHALNDRDRGAEHRQGTGGDAREPVQTTSALMIIIGVEVAHERVSAAKRDVPDVGNREARQGARGGSN